MAEPMTQDDIIARIVKPLVWEGPCKDNNYCHIARSIFGEYYVSIDGGRHQAWLEAHIKPYENMIGEAVGNLWEAQAAAEADYRARLAAALNLDGVAALVEALGLADDALTEAEAILGGEYGDHYGTLCETMLKLRGRIAALSAFTPITTATPPVGAEGEE